MRRIIYVVVVGILVGLTISSYGMYRDQVDATNRLRKWLDSSEQYGQYNATKWAECEDKLRQERFRRLEGCFPEENPE